MTKHSFLGALFNQDHAWSLLADPCVPTADWSNMPWASVITLCICGSVSVCMYTYACSNKLWNVPCNYCVSGGRERERERRRHTAAVLPQGSPQECSSTLIPSAAAGSIRGTGEGTTAHMHVISITKTRNHACTSLFHAQANILIRDF